MDIFNFRVEKFIYHQFIYHMMDTFTEDLLRLFSSTTRCSILELMSKGYDHPEDLAKKLELTRQGIDKHLLELHDWGLVERNAIFPPDGRPKIVYELTGECRQLLDTLDKVGDSYRESMIYRAETAIEHLDSKLAEGELDEEIYERKIKEIKKRWRYHQIKNEKD